MAGALSTSAIALNHGDGWSVSERFMENLLYCLPVWLVLVVPEQ